MKINIHDVARKSGLSVVTVSRVINGSPSVRAGNRQKVLDAIDELGYRPHSAARSLSSGRTGIIGVIVGTLHDTFFDLIVQQLNETLSLHGYFLVLAVTGSGAEADASSGHYLMQEDRVDGLILLSPVNEAADVAELERRGIPYALIDNQLPAYDAWSVNVGNYEGGRAAARHLLSLGHRSIAHLCGGELYRSTQERRRGFLDELSQAGIEPFELAQGEYSVEFGYQSARSWLEDGRLPTAVFAGDDHIALGAINALTEAGLRVPGDVSVVGFDDQLLASQLRPHLTTVRQPAAGIGQAAAELLLARISSGEDSAHADTNDARAKRVPVQLPPELIVRQSTAQPREERSSWHFT